MTEEIIKEEEKEIAAPADYRKRLKEYQTKKKWVVSDEED